MSESTHPDMDSLAVSDHFRLVGDGAADPGLTPGVYRVVGTPNDRVTLLRVADAVGRREYTGEVHSAPRSDLDAFESAENPDENRSLAATVSAQLDGLAWQLRLIGQTIRARPVPSAVALALVVVGLFGDPYLPIPDLFDTLLFLAGVVLLLSLTRTTESR